MGRVSVQATAVAVGTTAFAALALLTDSVYLLRLYSVYAFHTSLGLAVTLLFGVAGQVVIFAGALAGTSAYVASLSSLHLGLGHAVAAALGILSGTSLGTALVWLASRWELRGIQVGILTLLASLAFEALILGNRAVTFGEVGFSVVDPLTSSGLGTLYALRVYAVAGLLLTSGLTLAMLRMRGGRLWTLFRAAGEDPDLLRTNALDPVRYKAIAAAISSAIASAAGILYVYSTGYISPSTYSVAEADIPAYLVAAIGGLGNPVGALLGGAVILALKELTRAVGPASVAVYGLALLSVFAVRIRARKGARTSW
jgi:branched-chain amino acid transport system permease protein